MRPSAILLALVLVATATYGDDKPIKPIPPAEAAKKTNETVTVEMVVKSTGGNTANRFPRAQRPYCRVIWVFALVSSMNTSLAGSSPGIRSVHSCRFCFTSGRSCSAARITFFKRQVDPPQVLVQG